MDVIKAIGRVFLKLAFLVLGGYLIITVPDVEWAGDGAANVIPLMGFAAGILIWIGIWIGTMGVSTWRYRKHSESGGGPDFVLHLAALLFVFMIPVLFAGFVLFSEAPSLQYAEYNRLMVLILSVILLLSGMIGAGLALLFSFIGKFARKRLRS